MLACFQQRSHIVFTLL